MCHTPMTTRLSRLHKKMIKLWFKLSNFSSNYKETIKEWNEEIILTEIPKLQNKEDTSVKYEEDDRESAVTMDKVIIIIVASSASTAVSMVICCIFVLIFRRLLCKNHCTDRKGTFNAGIATNVEITTHPSTLQEQHFTVNTNGNSDSQYETIDESSIIEMSNVRTDEERLASRNTNISSSSSDSKISNASGVASEDTEGYIHPYNTLEENWQSKGYQYTLCIAKTYTSKIPKQKLTAEEDSAKTSHFIQ
ncbi:Hypothetical predicted protein [Mytilus galloprovincialis]|uniref:Uncharacterized protein n=1 Tax=Mytilus galloprovincialis TaxID=29158 RepID=A0A8B6GTI4_MYTGA|nr:Hypothetical predicted protein [Mytilus galloprovincialis]